MLRKNPCCTIYLFAMARAQVKTKTQRRTPRALQKTPTGIPGFDQVTYGGLPKDRTTLIAGGAGSGKTMLAMEFIFRGITEFSEPGVCISFEESHQDLAENFSSLGYDLPAMIRDRMLVIDYVQVDRKQIIETGEFDLDPLFIRLDQAIKSIRAKRVVIDTLEVLFTGFQNQSVIRAELRRFFHWLKDRGITSIVTGESGTDTLTRDGLEEYVADCVIALDHRVTEQVSTRRLRVVKYRGSPHGTNEYPFLLDASGITVVPITAIGLNHKVSSERISSGVAGLDDMTKGQGFYRGSSILVSGTAGTGKSSFSAFFVDAACRRGERAVYIAFEEGREQIIRNMRSVGLDLQKWIDKGKLDIHAARPTSVGLESHLARIYKIVNDIKPDVVVVDPISNLLAIGDMTSVKAMLTRLIDHFKSASITAMFTNLSSAGSSNDDTEVGVSSLMDTWIVLLDVARGDFRHRQLKLLKSRGMAHSNQTRPFTFTSEGIIFSEL